MKSNPGKAGKQMKDCLKVTINWAIPSLQKPVTIVRKFTC